MAIRRAGWMALLAVAGLALWLLLGSGRILGLDVGGWGFALLVATAWIALHGVSAMPQGEFERGVSPAEWKAWIGLGFMSVATVAFVANHDALAGAPSLRANRVVRDLALLLVAWLVLERVVAARWKTRVQQDERDREIAARAVGWGRGALIAAVVGLAVMFGFSPAERLAWATPFAIGHLLVFALMWGWLVEYAATVALYVRDRRQACAP